VTLGDVDVWHRGTATPIPLVPGADFGSALDINDRGDVVGYSGFLGGESVTRGSSAAAA
jgi:hypothetical protein